MKRAFVSAVTALCLLSAFGASRAEAESLDRIWSAANEAYFHGQYARAAEQYQRLIDAGVRDADVYFNLALADARQGRLGRSVLEFERSLWLRPGDDGAEQELNAARAALGRKRAEREGQALVQARPPLIEALVRPFSENTLAVFVLVLDFVFFALLVWRPHLKSDSLRLGVGVALPLIALALLAGATGLLAKTEALKPGAAAIVVRDGAELREGPDAHAQVRATAHEGQSARLLRREGSFASVELEGGVHGWIAEQDLGTVRPD